MFDLRSGWGASYPETTGYIIPTFLNYWKRTGESEYYDRAIRMAKWESSVQMQSGAVQGGTMAHPPSPAIFNTGQVIFGWGAAYKESKEPVLMESMKHAADYLCEMQDSDGAWRRNLTAFCSAPVDSYAYNIRTACALLIASVISGEARYAECGKNNIEYVMGITRPENRWTEKNCLVDPAQPLLHTIAYTFQGLLECALLSGRHDALEMVAKGNSQLHKAMERHGGLYGRYDAAWHPTVRWRCLTGEAQTAIVWFRLADVTGDQEWRKRAVHLTTMLKRTQALAGDPNIVGGIKGSYPVYGWYGKFEYLNWAAKFFADALMLDMGDKRSGLNG